LKTTVRAYARTVIVAVIAAGLLVATFGVAEGDDAPAFRNGVGKATAVAVRIAPGVGSLQLGLAAGVSVAEYKNDFSQAESQPLDLGLIGGIVTAPSECTGRPIIPAESLPQPTRVDNRKGNAELVEDAYPVAGTTLGAGHKEARATTAPWAEAVSDPILSILEPILRVDALKSKASTGVINGNTREAHATVETSLNLAGIQLSALKWDAVHRTGAENTATATFDPGTASLLGVPVPLEALGDLETVINNLLGQTGLSVSFPRLERFTEPADIVRMTPLRIMIKDSPLGGQVLGPILNLTREQREQVLSAISNTVCELAGAPLLVDIGVGVAGGTGSLTVDIGGVEVTTSDLAIENPFGDAVAPPAIAGPSSLPTIPTIPGSPAITVPPARQEVASVGPLRDRCESVNTKSDTACSKGTLLAVGLLGLVATVGVGLLDWRHQRRRRAAARAQVVA
jgi:hypothetical protein